MELLASQSSPELDGRDVLAIVVSLFAPGLGHVILGQALKGLVIMAFVIASCGVGYVVCAIIALDAYMVARAKKVRSVGDWETFPEARAVFRA